VRTVRKFFVSGFVIFTFIAYALHERFGNPDSASGAAARAPATAVAAAQALPSATQAMPTSSASPRPAPTATPANPPTQAPAPTAATADPPTQAPAVAQHPYRDGQFTGSTVDAFYGLVQVQAVIQGGKIENVQFLEYPNDRRTSIRINKIAMPYLTTEAIQVQSAEVDVISGATLTSEAFIESLQSALDEAKA
jgi:uncharacterized protein with FMN-binding domain